MDNSADLLLDNILTLSEQLSDKENDDDVIAKAMETAAGIADADGCFFFHITPASYMNLVYSRIESLRLLNEIMFPSVFLPEIKDKPEKQLAETCALTKEVINSTNIFNDPGINDAFLKKFDDINNYTTVSALVFPLFDSQKNIIGVAMFINARDSKGKIISFTQDNQKKMMAVCQILAVIMERKHLSESYTQLLESFVGILARAIDAKSPYTGLHCQKVPIITRLLTAAAVAEKEGPLKNFEMSDNDWYALHIASWLHDCGKIITPEYLVDKSAKLETIYNRIHEIRDRFEILRRDAHIEYLQKRLNKTDTKEKLQAEFVEEVKILTDDFEFIGKCNVGDTPLTKEDYERLDTISHRSFTRYFSRMVGLSWSERKLINTPAAYTKPELEYLLQDRPEQIAAPYNQGELTNLKVARGTINNAERKKINEHIITTINILKSLPFPPELKNIVEYAGAHHERVDGKGYPNGLKGNQMSIPAKIMAIADVYEALTAKDRPYKEPKKLSEVLRIMQEMKNSGHLDPDLYDLFIKSGVYIEYAKDYIDKSQIDEINPEEFL